MHVFHFILDYRPGGPHVYVLSLANALKPTIQSTLVTAGRGPITDLALLNLRHFFKLLYPFEVVINIIFLCWQFRKGNDRKNIIFDVHGASNLAPIFAARLLGVPLVWHFHETLISLKMFVAIGKVALIGFSYECIVVAAGAKTIFDLPDALLIPYGVDAKFWKVASSTTSNDSRPASLLFVGNINPLKGIDILLDSLQALRFPWNLTIAGSELQTFATYAAQLRRRSAILENPNCQVNFAGWLSPEAIRNLLTHTDFFILPSRSEACPISLLEAMASERVCIATNVGDIAKILGPSGCGFLVPSNSSADLTVALIQAFSLGNIERQAMGRRARAKIIADYSHEAMVNRHLEIYMRLTDKI